LIAINVLIRVAAAATGQILAFLVAERLAERLGVGTGALFVGLIASSFYVTELIGAPIAGRVADTRGQVRVLRWGPGLGFVATIGAAIAASGKGSILEVALTLVAVRVLEGLSAACAVPTTLALLGQATESRAASRLRLMGAFEIASLVGLVVGYVSAGMAWDALGGSALFLFAAAYGVAWFIARAPAQDVPVLRASATPVRHAMESLFRLRGVLPFMVAWLSVNAVVGVWVQQAPYLMKLPERSDTQVLVGGYSGTAIGLIFGAWAAIFLVGIALWSMLAPSWPRRRTLLTALCGMLAVVVALTMFNHGATQAVLALAIVAVLVESGFTPAAFAHMADLTDVRQDLRGMAMGVYSMLLGAGQLAGAMLGGPASSAWQMDGVLGLTGALAIVAILAVLRMPSGIAVSSGLEARPSLGEAK
jgi:MFS family permease